MCLPTGNKNTSNSFNKDVHKWSKSFELNQSYYIINDKLNGANPNFLFVHKNVELVFNNIIEVVECNSQFTTK
ncbi:hypothetical protein R3W88_031981 [Solanum pinnatisectum]|uniref:Uncharacterized protein n=1 Tax=Solanum pinnatisectum TaxID=50273 RepID=A0AAV9LPT6_9SOLN|nr:hypothetical protein R3W88_031981 [Solanum pinnatisectum]